VISINKRNTNMVADTPSITAGEIPDFLFIGFGGGAGLGFGPGGGGGGGVGSSTWQ
jgi:hypothetical protein